jgi:hypothetical protein
MGNWMILGGKTKQNFKFSIGLENEPKEEGEK